MTKLKDLRKMKIWDYADIVSIRSPDGKEIEITSESKRRELNNKEVTSWDTELKNGLRVLNVVLNV